MKRRIIAKMQNQKGMTMISVLVAFTLLLLLLLIFSQAVNLSLNLYRKSEDIRKESDARFSSFYRETTYSTEESDLVPTKENYSFVTSDGDRFEINDSGTGSYTPASGENKVWFFGNRKEVAP